MMLALPAPAGALALPAPAPVRVVAVVSPFISERAVLDVPAGGSIADILRTLGLPPGSPARIFVNDEIVLDEDRATTVPPAGALVTIRAVPKAGAVAALLIVLTSAVTTTAAAAAGLTGIGAAVLPAVVSGAVGLVGQLILKALIPPPTAPKPNLSSTPATYSISGQSNQLAPYAPIGRVFGTRRISPVVVGKSYTEIEGNDQFLRVVFSGGYGPLRFSQTRIADSLLSSFQNVEWEQRLGFPDDAPLTLYTNDVDEQMLNMLLLDTANKNITPRTWQQQDSAEADELSIDLTCPQGLQTINDVGNRRKVMVAWKARYAPIGTTAWVYISDGGAVTTSAHENVIQGVTGAIVRKSVRWRTPARARYTVQVCVTQFLWQDYKYHFDDTFFGTTFWTALRSVRNVDPCPKKGIAKMALRIRASNQLSGQISELTTIASAIIKDYDPVAMAWDNRAGGWDYEYTGGDWLWSLSTIAHTAGGKSLCFTPQSSANSAAIASYGIPIIGRARHTLTVSGWVKSKLGAAAGQIKARITVGADDRCGGFYVNWAAGVQRAVGDRVQPTVGNPGGYHFECVFPGKSGTTAPAWKQGVGDVTLDGPEATGAQWVNRGGPALWVADLFSGAVGTGWTFFSTTVVVPYPPPSAWSGTQSFHIGDVVWYSGFAWVCLRANTGVAPTVAGTWQKITTASFLGANFMRIECYVGGMAAGNAAYFDDFKVVWAPGSTNVLPNGSFDYPGTITANPASAFREILQGSANKRPAPDSKLDLPAIQAWHVYAKAGGHFFNGTLDKKTTVYEALRQVAAVGRASFFQRDQRYSVVLDQPQALPMQHFSPRNSWGFRGIKDFPDLPHALRVRFVNAARDYQVDEIIAYDAGYTAANATKFELLDLSEGVAAFVLDFHGPAPKGSQPWRDAIYHMAQARLRPETYQLSADMESIVCTRGDLVYVAHDVPEWGRGFGRITNMTVGGGRVLTVTLDETLYGDGVHQCVLRVRNTINGSQLINVGVVPSSGLKTLTLVTPIYDGRLCDVGCLALFGFLNSEAAQLIVTAIERGPDLTATLYLQDYAPSIYALESQGAPGWVSTLRPSTASNPPTPTIVAVRTDQSVMARDTQGTLN